MCENVDMPANSAKAINTNSVAVETEAVNVGGKMIDPLAKNVEVMLTGAPGPSIKSVVVGGPVLIYESKSPLQPRVLFKVLNFMSKSVPLSPFSWLSLMDIDLNTSIPSFIMILTFWCTLSSFCHHRTRTHPSKKKHEVALGRRR